VRALERAGYRVLERNFRCRGGELDIVAEHDDTLCFIEVRTRRVGAMVDGRSSVDARKRRKLVRAAQVYCQARAISARAMRFDVVEVRARADGAQHTEIIRNAFDAEGGL
jgi:putative endonuclease